MTVQFVILMTVLTPPPLKALASTIKENLNISERAEAKESPCRYEKSASESGVKSTEIQR